MSRACRPTAHITSICALPADDTTQRYWYNLPRRCNPFRIRRSARGRERERICKEEDSYAGLNALALADGGALESLTSIRAAGAKAALRAMEGAKSA